MDDVTAELYQFALKFFDNNGMPKPEFMVNDYHKGPGCFGAELNESGLIYVEKVKVKREYRNQGLGGWALRQFFYSDQVNDSDFIVVWPGPYRRRVPTSP
ncbi:hypothetical protein EIP91_010742 [Steccherinum ochraceum]|uniref:Uncharacterized protein n=1 Tax=Steccherinum ochraceum TaxID=92696 RepID=A0A4R0RLL6_9APHY|nr:hypothetical protein EIP91_010742 [Steccherinum ochraceum]